MICDMDPGCVVIFAVGPVGANNNRSEMDDQRHVGLMLVGTRSFCFFSATSG